MFSRGKGEDEWYKMGESIYFWSKFPFYNQ